jgi:hypothetical protein
VKEVEGELKPNVVVVVASNNVLARALLVQNYGVENEMIPSERHWWNDQPGIKAIRQAETNTYVDDEGNISHDPRT